MPSQFERLIRSYPSLLPCVLTATLSAQVMVSLEVPAPGLQCTSYVSTASSGTIPIFAGTLQPFGPVPLYGSQPTQVLGMFGMSSSETTCAISLNSGASPDENILDVHLRARGAFLPSSYYTLYGPFYPEADLQGALLVRVHSATPSALFLEATPTCSTPVGGFCTSHYTIDVMSDGVLDVHPQSPTARARLEPDPNGSPIRIDFDLHTNGDLAQSSVDLHIRIRIAPALAASVTSFGSSCPIAGTQPVLTAGTNLPQLGQTCTFLVTSLPTTSSHAVLGALSVEAGSLGGAPLPIDLTPIGMPGCAQYIDPILTMLYGTVATNGTATWPLYIPDEPWVLGLPFYAQCLVDAPGENPLGLVTTNALACVAGL